MSKAPPHTIAEYIAAAPAAGQPHLRRVYALLQEVAPHAQEVIKWGTPFFVEPRFLFAFSAHKAHLNFTLAPEALEAFREELAQHGTTKNFLQIPYTAPLPEDLLRRIAGHRVKTLSGRTGSGFW